MDLELRINRKEYCVHYFDSMTNESVVLSNVFQCFLDAYGLSKDVVVRYDDRSGAPEQIKPRTFKDKNIRTIIFRINDEPYPLESVSEALAFFKQYIDERKAQEEQIKKEKELLFDNEFNAKINSLSIDQKKGLLLLLEGLQLLK